jgi:hypothetical protein
MQTELGISDTVVAICQDRENWQGSYYELGMGFAQGLPDQQARLHLLHYLWQDSHLLGVLKDPNGFGQLWQSLDGAVTTSGYHSYGCIRLDNERIIGCGTVLSKLEEELWFVLYIPLRMLELVYAVDYNQPITHEGNPWTIEVDEVLASIGRRVYQEMPFTVGVMGEEASASLLERLMAKLPQASGLLVPEVLFRRMGITPHGVRSPEGLWWTGGKEGKEYHR